MAVFNIEFRQTRNLRFPTNGVPIAYSSLDMLGVTVGWAFIPD